MAIVALVALGGLAAAGVVIVVHLLAAARNAVGPVMTPAGAVSEIVRALELPERGRVWDLGCGDGRVLAAAAAARPKLELAGVENNPVVWALARWNLRKTGSRVRLGEILAQDLSGTERVFCYLGPGLMKALEPKFERELPKGARLVSQQFPLPTRRPDLEITLKHGRPYAAKLYIYDY